MKEMQKPVLSEREEYIARMIVDSVELYEVNQQTTRLFDQFPRHPDQERHKPICALKENLRALRALRGYFSWEYCNGLQTLTRT